jgi:hypothetical protein
MHQTEITQHHRRAPGLPVQAEFGSFSGFPPKSSLTRPSNQWLEAGAGSYGSRPPPDRLPLIPGLIAGQSWLPARTR